MKINKAFKKRREELKSCKYCANCQAILEMEGKEGLAKYRVEKNIENTQLKRESRLTKTLV